MNKEWSELCKSANSHLAKKITFEEGKAELLKLRSILYKEFVSFTNMLHNPHWFSAQPLINSKGYDNKTIGYSIYHVIRIEDIVSNILIGHKDDIMKSKNYEFSIKTTGNELKGNDIKSFTETIDTCMLYEYMTDVYLNTNEWIKYLTYEELKIKFTDEDKERLDALEVVDKSEEWLVEYWVSKSILGLIGMPLSRHWIMHTEAAIRIMNKLSR